MLFLVFMVTTLVCFFTFAREAADAFGNRRSAPPRFSRVKEGKGFQARPRLQEKGG
jgi:hypothetical protein